jgi:dTDP-3-amino-3,4,6-trideoxy-alpha-D-glucose transaminase
VRRNAAAAIPLFASRGAIEPLIPEILDRQRAIVESGKFVLGPELEAFEAELAAYVGVRHCIGVANGTEALTIALRSAGVGSGDEVVVPALSFVATAEAVVNAGAKPVFADIDPRTHCMSAATAEPVIGPRTRALMPVHLFGNVAPMDELNELAAAHGITVIEDAAQAAGATLGNAKAGALALAAGFSFYPGKNLGAFGDGGAITTDDDDLAASARLLRHHGTTSAWLHAESGYTSRLDDIQAAVLRVLLPHLDEWTAARRRAAQAYRDEGLGEGVQLQEETAGSRSAHHLFVAMNAQRDRLVESLAAAGIESRPYYPTPLHLQPSMSDFKPQRSLPNAERLARENFALPMGPALEPDAPRLVSDAIRTALAG